MRIEKILLKVTDANFRVELRTYVLLYKCTLYIHVEEKFDFLNILSVLKLIQIDLYFRKCS